MPWPGARLILTRGSFLRALGPSLLLGAAAAAYGVALHASAPDQGCAWNCATVVTPRGESFRDHFPSVMTTAGIEWFVLVPVLLRWMGFGGEARDGG